MRHLRLYRQGRFEIAPSVSFSLLDEYRRTILVGRAAQLQHHGLARDRRLGRGRRRQLDHRPDRQDQRDRRRATPLTAINVNHSGFPSGQAPGTRPRSPTRPRRSRTSSRRRSRSSRSAASSPSSTRSSSTPTSIVAGGVAFVGIQERGDCGGQGQVVVQPARRRSTCSRRRRSRRRSAWVSRSTRATSSRSASSTARSPSRGTAPGSTRAARARTGTSRTARSTARTRRSSSTSSSPSTSGFSFPTTPKISE